MKDKITLKEKIALGKFLQKAREEQNISKHSVRKMSGLQYHTINSIESGTVDKYSIDSLIDYCVCLGLQLTESLENAKRNKASKMMNSKFKPNE